MTRVKTFHYRHLLEDLSRRCASTSETWGEGVHTSANGTADGGLAIAPMHRSDVGSETDNQELSTTLLNNDNFVRQEVNDALERIDKGEYGICEECEQTISTERLEAMPYARYCVQCAE